MLKIRDLFARSVTRAIPPVVYFHEQSPQKLADEVSEYIVTGGFDDGHPGKRRVPEGIHEQYVRLLRAIVREASQPGGPTLPTSWISGFYGSGKSSFAKLLGMALDGVALPDGTSLAKAWLDRNETARRHEMVEAWDALHKHMQPIAVVFDIGGVARDGEHVHTVVLRKVQQRLGYCTTDPHVGGFELNLERSGEYGAFLDAAQRTLGRPWEQVRDEPLAEEAFSQVMHTLHPERYTDPMSWFLSRAGEQPIGASPRDVCLAIRDMLGFRAADRTLFVIVDEVSQYVVNKTDRTDRLRAFAQELGGTLKGRAWLLALGQQKIDVEFLFGGVFVGVAEKDPKLALVGDILHPAHDGGEEGILDVRHDQADDVGPLRAQTARHTARPIAEIGDGVEHTFAHGRADMRFSGEDTGDSGSGHTGPFRHVGYFCRHHSLGICEIDYS